MTVRELIAELEKADPDSVVLLGTEYGGIDQEFVPLKSVSAATVREVHIKAGNYRCWKMREEGQVGLLLE